MDGPLLQLGDRIVDLDAHEVRHGDERIALSRNEVALLRHLWERVGQVVTRETLLQEVLGYAPQVVSRAADYAVHRLRKKLEIDPSEPDWLLTAPGVGFRLVVDGERPAAPEVREAQASLPALAGLPSELTSFVGRDAEIRDIVALLDAGQRLVTITGPGGVGKTRLALRAASVWLEARPAAAVLCRLEHTVDADSLRGAVGAAMGLDPEPGTQTLDHLGRALAARGLALLILDNLEQVADAAAAACARWLELAPQLVMLTTSRERLRIPGERAWVLEPLDPHEGRQLFQARAGEAGAELEEGADDGLANLLERLDGLPLAIELAAARATVLSPRQLLQRLDAHYELGPAPRGAPRRQSSVDEVIAWSWQLLSSAEQHALCALASVRADFDIDDAEQVVGDPAGQAVELVGGLLDKSLLSARAGGEARRFGMLRTVRAFAEARDPEPRQTWLRHAGWLRRRVEGAADTLLWDHDAQTAELLDGLQQDLVAAIDHLGQLGDEAPLRAELILAACHARHRSGSSLAYLAQIREALATPLAPSLRVPLELTDGVVREWEGLAPRDPDVDWAELRRLAAPDPDLAVRVLLCQGSQLQQRGESVAAAAVFDEAALLLKDRPLERLHVVVALRAANTAGERGLLDEAIRLAEEGLRLCDRLGPSALPGRLLANLAQYEGRRGRRAAQARFARRALLEVRASGDGRMERRALFTLATAEAELGEFDQAVRHASDALALTSAAQDLWASFTASQVLIEVDFARGELDEVRRHLRLARLQMPQDGARFAGDVLAWYEALEEWARLGWDAQLVGRLTELAEHLSQVQPYVAWFFHAKVLAARAYLADAKLDQLALEFDELQASAQAQQRLDQLRSLKLDRAHLDLAAARRSLAQGQDPRADLAAVEALLVKGEGGPTEGVLAEAVSRLLLASSLAELEQGSLRGPWGASGRGA